MPEPMTVHPVVLQDTLVRLEPLTPNHRDALLGAMEPDTFIYMATAPAALTSEGVRVYIADLLGRPDQVASAVVHKPSGCVIGSTSYMSIRPVHRGLQIGCTWLNSRWRGTGVNTAMKRLMLTHAFESLGAIRIEPRTDAVNTRSRGAIEKLEAEQEALFKRHMVLPDGRLRDSVVYAITDDRWPQIKTRLGSFPGSIP